MPPCSYQSSGLYEFWGLEGAILWRVLVCVLSAYSISFLHLLDTCLSIYKAIPPCKAKMQYLLTLEVSRYFILSWQSSMHCTRRGRERCHKISRSCYGWSLLFLTQFLRLMDDISCLLSLHHKTLVLCLNLDIKPANTGCSANAGSMLGQLSSGYLGLPCYEVRAELTRY